MKCNHVPITSPERLKKYSKAMLDSFKEFKVYACHDLAEGGLAVAIAEMCVASGIGAEIDVGTIEGEAFIKLFAESNTRWIVEIREEDTEDFIRFFKDRQLKAYNIGYTSSDKIKFTDKIEFGIPLDQADKAWRSGLTRYTGW
jgi:phosphoribosylformylglycinamidine synthase